MNFTEEQMTPKPEKKIGEMSPEEKVKYFEQHLSPLIRYGFTEYGLKLYEWLKTIDDEKIDRNALLEKMNAMSAELQQVNFDFLASISKEQGYEIYSEKDILLSFESGISYAMWGVTPYKEFLTYLKASKEQNATS